MLTSIKGHNSGTNKPTMTGNNLKLDPVNMNAYILKDFENASPRLNPLFHKP